MTASLEPNLLTANEYGQLPDDGRWTELIQGTIVEKVRPYTSHGYYLAQVGSIFYQFVERHQLGRMTAGGAGVITQHDPDTVRGPDLAFYSYTRIPPGPLSDGYWPVSPELIFEIYCPTHQWDDLLQKVTEYLNADVLTVGIIDPTSKQVQLYSANREMMLLGETDLLQIPEILPEFAVSIHRLFE